MSDHCANCGHSRAKHEVMGGYKPYGHCNHGHDLCGCTQFVEPARLPDQQPAAHQLADRLESLAGDLSLGIRRTPEQADQDVADLFEASALSRTVTELEDKVAGRDFRIRELTEGFNRMVSARMAAERAVNQLAEALSRVLDAALERWHDAPSTISVEEWMGLTVEQYAMYAEGRWADLAAALSERHNPWDAACTRNLPGEPTREGARCLVCRPEGGGT